jgi:4-amino-4-deoxy-L-arabinose transferase-like glycosyltransferase
MKDQIESAATTSSTLESEANAPGPAAADSDANATDDQAGAHRETRALHVLATPRFALPLIVAIGALLFIVNLGGYSLYTKGEPREAVTVFDIVHGGGVILPMRAGVEIPSKPLLMHWLAALVSIAAGRVNEWTVRLPSAIFAILGMVVCYGYVRILFEARAALIAALILGTSFQYLQAGSGARVDMTLTFFMQVAFFEFIAIAEGLSGRTALLYFAMALAMLSKGPVGVALPVMVAMIWMALWRRWDLIPRLRLGRGALIVGIVGGGWYLAAIATGGMDFVRKQILAENLYRLFHHSGFHEGHAHPFYYEEGALIGGLMPWSPIALIAAIQYVRRQHKIDARFSYLIVWFLTVLIFYNIPQSKRGIYLMALYPALSAMIAILICNAIDYRPTIARWVGVFSRAAGVCFVVAGISALAGIALLHVSPTSILGILSLFGILATELPAALESATGDYRILSLLVPAATSAIGVYLLFSRPLVEKMIAGIAAGFVCIALAVNLVVEPAIAETLSLKDFAIQAMNIAGARPVGYFGSLDYAFAFYSGRNVILTSPLDSNAPDLMVTAEDGWNLAGAKLRARYAIVLRSNPTELDGTGRLLLLKRISAAPSPTKNNSIIDHPGY